MEEIKKHANKLIAAIDARKGKGAATEILGIYAAPSGNETPEETALWAAGVIQRLEAFFHGEELISLREECACIKANKYSTYNTKYFKELRLKYQDDDTAYLKAVAEFMDGRGRCGRKVEYKDGKIISHFSFSNACCCNLIKGGWKKPPSITWCRCCQGTVSSIYRFVFTNKTMHTDIVETFATGGTDCVFATWFTDKC